ncbi:hypothetical protein SLEP1_g47791 [Rubroshorea leprosula]|uniref:Uncharacterized protein n=1 Tax=Rubroshorea leprosula TaxID=152421 RepID=A0AAV5LSG8_9ROSI|nr:hypothetical protein SLEP1_g47791 [Rubroshorea leprosula]
MGKKGYVSFFLLEHRFQPPSPFPPCFHSPITDHQLLHPHRSTTKDQSSPPCSSCGASSTPYSGMTAPGSLLSSLNCRPLQFPVISATRVSIFGKVAFQSDSFLS